MIEFQEPNPQADFNSGLSMIFQLDAIERAMIIATLENNYNEHYRLLKCYFKTILPLTTDTEKNPERSTLISMWNKIKENFKEYEKAINQKKLSLPSHILDEFDYFEIELRDCKQRNGVGMPRGKDPRTAMMR